MKKKEYTEKSMHTMIQKNHAIFTIVVREELADDEALLIGSNIFGISKGAYLQIKQGRDMTKLFKTMKILTN